MNKHTCPNCQESFGFAGESSDTDFEFVYCPHCSTEIALAVLEPKQAVA